MENQDYIVIGFSETYAEERIEPFYAELRNPNESKMLAYKFTEAEIREFAKEAASKRNIPFLEELMI